MKNQNFPKRFLFALNGIRSAWRAERSFRTQVTCGVGAIAVLVVFHASPVWWALFLTIIGAVLAAELTNTALEHVIDRLHPEADPLIGTAKDCAAGAVLVLGVVSIALLICFLVSHFCLP